jgi:hypothetical protein
MKMEKCLPNLDAEDLPWVVFGAVADPEYQMAPEAPSQVIYVSLEVISRAAF